MYAVYSHKAVECLCYVKPRLRVIKHGAGILSMINTDESVVLNVKNGLVFCH